MIYGALGGMAGHDKLACPFIAPSVQTYPKRSTIRYANWQVRKHSEHSVRQRAPERKIMGDFVYGQEKVLIRSGADDVSRQKEWP